MAERSNGERNYKRRVGRLLAAGTAAGGLLLGAACGGDGDVSAPPTTAAPIPTLRQSLENTGPREGVERVGDAVGKYLDTINAIARQGNTASRRVVSPVMEMHPRSFSILADTDTTHTKFDVLYTDTARAAQPGRYQSADLDMLVMHQRTADGPRSVTFTRERLAGGEPSGYSVWVSGFPDTGAYYALTPEAEATSPAQNFLAAPTFDRIKGYADELLAGLGPA